MTAAEMRRAAVQQLQDLLAERYPAIFTWPPQVPLAIGIHEKIIEATGSDPMVVTWFLRGWTNHIIYHRRIAIGEQRQNLDGSPADVPDETARERARIAIATIKAKRHVKDQPPAKAKQIIQRTAGEPIVIKLTARKLKVTTMLDPKALTGVAIGAGAPARTILALDIDGRTYRADVATKSVQRALAAIREHGPDGVAVMLQGSLTPDGTILEAGLSAPPKVKPAEKAKAA